MKNRIVLFIAGCCALLLSSCLGSDDTQYELSKDCQILSFSLSNDSIPGLKDVVFTIDQVDAKIQVLGTKFNVYSYPDSKQIRTSLIEGAVQVFYKSKQVILRPNKDSNRAGI